jgi:serine protease Do
VAGPNDVIDTVSQQKIGAKVDLEYVRDGKRRAGQVTLEELPTDADQQRRGPDGQQPRLGIGLQTLSDPLARSLGIPPGTKGAVITDVAPNSPAARAGLNAGEVIVEVDRKPVASAEDAAALIGRGDKKPRLLRVTSPAGTRFVTVTPE